MTAKKTTLNLTEKEFCDVLGRDGVRTMEKMNEAMSEIGRQIAADQMAWVDKCMADLLPPDIYDKAKRLNNLEEVAAYMHRHKIKLIHMMDTLRVRIMVGNQIYGEWKPNITMDGEPVEWHKDN